MTINFWSTDGTYGCFSNFSRHAVVIGGKRFKSTEHFYQSQKFATTDPLYANKIAKASTPREAANLGRDKSRKLLRKDWERAKLGVMRVALRAKVEQHPEILELLLQSGDRKIVENSPYDFFWGSGDDNSGQNWLGRLWMELRAEMQNKQPEEDEEDPEEFESSRHKHLGLKPKVWSKRKGAPKPPKGAVYVGRPSKWGNKFILENEEDREEVLAEYEEWLQTQPKLIAEAKAELRGKHLVCWCSDGSGKQLPCHGDILLRIANEDVEDDEDE